MFVDDIAFMVYYHQDALEIITSFSKSAKEFGLKINQKKPRLYINLMTLAKTNR